MTKILSTKTISKEEELIEKSLRPKTFDEVIGRENEKKRLRIMIESAKKRGDSLDHIIFHGPPGLGKTTFAHVIANDMGAGLRVTSGPAIERAGDLAAILTNLKDGEVLFIDEIHRINKLVEEVLYSAMEDYVLDIVVGKGPSAKTLRLDLPKFTLIGATTRMGLLGGPLRDRFGAQIRLDFMEPEELKELVLQKATYLQVEIDDDAAYEIAVRSRRTARIAIRLLKRVRDHAHVESDGKVDKDIVIKALELHNIDATGLDELDRQILSIIIDNYDGGPVGLSTISAGISEDVDTIEDVYEPFLLREGFLKRTARGRVATKKAYKHLDKLDLYEDSQNKLL
ncbi:Holliday junction branch migration DNA helicase RuvB [Candidatus Dojkabacteria bacterium]|uniref:Holliday junction branch migration complex subunit RuvB n=1 Tax=Candidatus Dojkabacteria bacterium TaxID=2099670 RepID=A0A955L3G4_9BACT|nr:Holliday junction branch migration DNA helicase RuvB [Candidatus Dojkabacteria bacterium]